MGGGLLQLVAYGAQDVYLTGNPQITFFKVVYRRHTNFSMESIEQTFNGTAALDRRVTCQISRNGDLIHRMYLQATVTDGAANANAGLKMIKSVELEIGGQRIDKQYGDWMYIWNELSLPSGKTTGYSTMVDAINGTTTLYVPLEFWFCRNPGLALPLIALQYHDVKINIDFRPIGECLWAVKSLSASSATQSVSSAYQQSLVAASLYVDYIFLDTDERRKMAQNPHEYLIEQIQFTGDESVGSSSNKIKLNFNHPCKELVWVVQPDENVDYCASLEGGETLYKTLGAQPFNYTDAIDALPNAIHAFGSDESISGTNAVISGGVFQLSDAGDVSSGVAGQDQGSSLSDAGTFVLAETALDMHCWGENPVVTAKLQLNGQDRFSEREGSYFDTVQPFQHHTRAPDTGINVYSFALRPEEHQPSGTCNFSRIDNAVLQLVLSSGTVSGVNTAKVRVYAVNYNVLRVMSGMAGVAYSN